MTGAAIGIFRSAAARTAGCFRQVAGGLLETVWPQTCAACDRWIESNPGLLCDGCSAALEISRSAPACGRCGRAMASASIHVEGCARCLHEHFWNLKRIVRVGSYEPPLNSLIIGLKFTGQPRQAVVLGRALAERLACESWIDAIDAFVPVPMHPLRRWQRPCDHALDLAEQVSRGLARRTGKRIPVQRSAIRRRKYAVSQTRTASRTERFANVRECFDASWRPNVRGKTICIIDNLLVTGATICEVSKVLRAKGAKVIYGAIVARSVQAGDFQAETAALNANRPSHS